MKFSILIDSGNAALVNAPESELGDILDAVKEKLNDGLGYTGGHSTLRGVVRDSNGTSVGTWEYVPFA